MKNLCIAAMTCNDQAHWDNDELHLGPFRLGRGWTDTRIPHEVLADGTAVFHGEQALRVLRDFDYIVLQHWPNENLLAYLQGMGSKVGFWLNIVSVQTTPLWNLVQEPLRMALASMPLIGTDGQQVVTWPGAIGVDFRNRDFVNAIGGVLEYIMSTSYKTIRPDFFFIDEATDRYYTTAPNAPTIETGTWVHSMNKAFDTISGLYAPVWGHNTGEFFQVIRHRVHEHATRGCTTKEEFEAKVRGLTLMAGGDRRTMKVGLGWQHNNDIPPDWFRYVDGQIYPAEILWQTARTGSAFQIFKPGAPQ